jgi:predicted membrane channel-forming protein YqfA (hemolysin III family)
MFTTFLFLLFSSIHHTFNCHSNEIWQCCYKMDLLGIMFQLVTATMCCLQFMFHDFDYIKRIYSYSFLILGCITIILSMFDFFISAKLNLFLMFLYATLFIISFLGSIHWVAIADLHEIECISPYILIGFVFIFIGFAIFLAKFPECIVQHKFIDYYFNSHIIWHLCVVGSAVCYYMMLHKYYLIVEKDG